MTERSDIATGAVVVGAASQLAQLKQRVRAVILAGSMHATDCRLAARLPYALWPVAGKAALTRLLAGLAEQGIVRATVCFEGDHEPLHAASTSVPGVEVAFVDEPMPLGTAGCLREAAQADDELFLVCQANTMAAPPVDELLSEHCRVQAALTMALNPAVDDGTQGVEAAGIYVCDRSVLGHVAKLGHCDIKETLIPKLLGAGQKMHAVTLGHAVETFRDGETYLRAMAGFLTDGAVGDDGDVRISSEADVAASARCVGPVVVLEKARVGEDAVILGPALIGRAAKVGQGSLVDGSVLWDGAEVGDYATAQGCLLDRGAVLGAGATRQEAMVAYRRQGVVSKVLGKVRQTMAHNKNRWQQAIDGHVESRVGRSVPLQWLGATALVLATLVWCYWRTLADLWAIWMRSDEFSSGLLVPFLAGYIIWCRRETLFDCPVRPSYWGLAGLIGALLFRYFGLFFMYGSAERLSLVIAMGALIWMILGWRVFCKLWTVWLFLFLMLPLPNRVQAAITLPLQNWATSSAVFLLEMLGWDIIREGNVIHLGETTVAVAEACNGLRMLTSFFVVSGLVVLLAERPSWQKVVILLSTLPIGLLCNTIRLAGTSIAFTQIDAKKWGDVFHDFGGYAMMPLALGLVVLELWFLKNIIVSSEPVDVEGVMSVECKG